MDIVEGGECVFLVCFFVSLFVSLFVCLFGGGVSLGWCGFGLV